MLIDSRDLVEFFLFGFFFPFSSTLACFCGDSDHGLLSATLMFRLDQCLSALRCTANSLLCVGNCDLLSGCKCTGHDGRLQLEH
jgi:hypothetical protein